MLTALYQKYKTDDYKFKELVEDILNVRDLERLHEHTRYDLFERANDQETIWHQNFYNAVKTSQKYWWDSAGGQFMYYYRQFVGEIEYLLGEPIIFQTIPTLRVHLPDNVAVGEWHMDSEYGHSKQEVNVWVPLTDARDTSAMFIEEDYPNDPESFSSSMDCHYGEYIVFDGANNYHGNVENETGKTRVSFDFRVMPKRLYQPSKNRSINSGMKFELGDYFSEF